MASDLPSQSRIGKRSPRNGLVFDFIKISEGLERKHQACSHPKPKGSMRAPSGPKNGLEKGIFGSDALVELKKHTKLTNRSRCMRPLLNVIHFVETYNRVRWRNGDFGANALPLKPSDQHHTDSLNHKKSYAWLRWRNLGHAQSTVVAYWSNYIKDAILKTDLETLAKVHNGDVRGSGKEQALYLWRKVLRCLQQIDPIAFNNITTILTAQSNLRDRIFKASDSKRGFSMAARTSRSYISSTTRKSSRVPSPLRKSKVRKSSKGRLQRSGGAPRTPTKIGAKSPRTFPKSIDSKRVAPIVLRRTQIRFKRHPSGEKMSRRLQHRSALRSGHRDVSWSADRAKAAILIQSQWRMFLARRSHRILRHAAITIQRRWRESRRLSSRTNSALDVTGEDIQKSSNTLGCPFRCLYDCDISATQEDEIFDEFLSFLPCGEQDSSVNGLSTTLTSISPYSSGFSSTVLADDSGKDLQSPSPSKTRTSNYDSCSLDSPACSPAKELTFAKISIEGSLPPTPIKEWSSRKRDPTKSSPSVPVILEPSTDDVVELHHSPTKDWATPVTKGRKSTLLLEGSPHSESKMEPVQLLVEFMNPEESDTTDSDRDNPEVTSIPLSTSSDPNMKSLHGCIVPTPKEDGVVPVSRALAYTPDDLNTNVPARVLDSPLSPALEEELLDELSKLFESSPDPVVPSDPLFSPSCNGRSVDDSFCPGSVGYSQQKTFIRVCNGAFVSDDFSHSARKLDFNLDDVDELGDCEGNLGACHYNRGDKPSDANSGNIIKDLEERSPPVSALPKPTLPEPTISDSHDAGDMAEQNDTNFLGLYDELDDVRASRDSRSYSKRCQATVQDFLQLVEQNHGTRDGVSETPQSGFEKSQSTYFQVSGSPLSTSEGEDDFCDKAVDGNVVAVQDAILQPRDLLPNTFEDPIEWEVVLDSESHKKVVDEPLKCGSVDRYDTSFSRDYSNFVTPKVSRSRNVVTRSCSAIYRSKPPLPKKSRRISFDEKGHKFHEHQTPPDEDRCVSSERKVCERLLHTSPASPDTPLVSYNPVLSSQERSSSLSVSKKYFLQSPSSRKRHGKGDSDTESAASSTCISPSKLDSKFDVVEKEVPSKHAGALFTGDEALVSNSTKHAFPPPEVSSKVSENGVLKSETDSQWDDVLHYSCFEDNYEAMLKQKDCHRVWFPEELSDPSLLTTGEQFESFRRSSSSYWDCGLMTLISDGGLMRAENSAPSLHDLCKLWDDNCIDLVTRSLKFKYLVTNPTLLRHEVKMAFSNPDLSSPEAHSWEVPNIERLQERLESRESLKELIKQQRDAIYINIATNASMRERYRLYSKWGIRRMSTGRLKKIIYDLLWKDPKRFQASADLVLQYL
uniref:lysozyme n=2 Tax=Physcomitrium patens TaxID=3218 RepID=A0A2K1KJ70_PHYPA|nr:hypothetical protein PHYPA_007480 [Physcomitrium patens]